MVFSHMEESGESKEEGRMSFMAEKNKDRVIWVSFPIILCCNADAFIAFSYYLWERL